MITNPSLISKLLKSKSWLILFAMIITALFVLALCFFSPPKWATNDDVAMSMIAHGYGIANIGSPNILFSNILWGYLVREIPVINGMLGYSTATLGVLIIVGGVITWSLILNGLGYVACISLLTLILAGPVLFPQFTINAGLLCISAILCWYIYARKNNLEYLLAGCTIAFLSYLVRGPEFLLVLVVAFPLLPWRKLLSLRPTKYAFCVLAISIGIAAIIDNQAYRGVEWDSFNELNPVRAAFTDYGAGEILKARPEILKRNGFSPNDIDLISHWFFVDADIANPKILQSMLNELGALSAQSNSLSNGLAGIQAMWQPQFLMILVPAFLLALLLPSWRIATSWATCITAFFTLGLLGRPGVFYVYTPLFCLLLIAPFMVGKISRWRMNFGATILVVAALANLSYVIAESKRINIDSHQSRTDMTNFPSIPVIIWGSTFPYEAIYPVLGASPVAMSYQHYGLGTSTLAPFTLAYAEKKRGREFKYLFTQNNGVPIMAYPANIKILEIYCKERLHGKLRELSRYKYGITKQYGEIEILFLKCDLK